VARQTFVNDDAPGCLTIPVLVVVVPLRLLWELLALIGRLLDACVLRPIRWVLHNAVVRPLRWLLINLVLRPAAWLLRLLIVQPLRWLARTVLAPIGRLLLGSCSARSEGCWSGWARPS
jgi:hypothetical protein